jgi:hypothetical protein
MRVGSREVHRAVMAKVHSVICAPADEKRIHRVMRRLGAVVIPERCQCSREARERGEPVVQFGFDADVMIASVELEGEVFSSRGAGPGALGGCLQ